MRAKILTSVFAMMMVAPVAASAREVPPLEYRAQVTEEMNMSAEDFTCSSGHAAGWLAAIAVVGVVVFRRRR